MTDARSLHVFGSFGYGNLGDELVPECLARLLDSVGHPVVTKPVTRFHGDLPVSGLLTRDTAPGALSQMPQGTPLVITGGGIIEPRDASCMNRAFDLVDTVTALRPLAFAVSVEPGIHFGFRDRRRLRSQLVRLGPVAVRDDLSARILRRLAPDHPIRTVGDIALWTDASSDLPPDARLMDDDPGVVVILQPSWAGEGFVEWITGELAALHDETGFPITLLPFSPMENADLECHRAIAQRLGEIAPNCDVRSIADSADPSAISVRSVTDVLSRARLCISSRLHGCVVAFAQRTPFVALGYHPKLKGFAETVTWEKMLLPEVLPTSQSPRTYGYAFQDLEISKGDLVAKAQRALTHSDFSAIDFYKARQQAVIREFLDL